MNYPGRTPESGEIVLLDAGASVQFAGDRAILLRVSKVDERYTYDGWTWLSGYQLDRQGNATAKRDVFVSLAGIKYRTGVRPPRPTTVP
ncbi:hypothetical protein ACI2K4_32050 [Micromonospora sp. NPDC050397]|uniref:hypothetical protein n=1 Tax=Micromonospora sp. NPDC050397 TaxID=3364279 RepID=UPI00384B8087